LVFAMITVIPDDGCNAGRRLAADRLGRALDLAVRGAKP
jgi:hypothetical protein